jgi:serine/threonine protein kinase/Tfp pilus assembly protein PilF
VLQCPFCYTINPDDSEFCKKCGSSIGESHDTLTSPLSKQATEKGFIYFSPGDLFADRYLIVEEIGRGGMGVVYKAEDRILGTSVALKIIHPLYASSPFMVDRFKEETLLARSITHENVIRIHDIGEKDDINYISMDYIKGQNLRDLIRTSRTLTVETATRISVQICRALQAAHDKGVIHRDLKPQNIMVDSTGKAITMDFGLAKSMQSRDTKSSRKIIGTPAYMSPEQARGEETNEKSDIYSLGIIMYEMFTGKRPFKADSKEGYIRKHLKEKPRPPAEINTMIPVSMASVITKCLEKNQNKRYGKAQEIIDDIQRPLVRTSAKTGRFSPRLLSYWYVVPLILIIGLGGYMLLRENLDKAPPSAPTVLETLGPKSIAIFPFENNTGDESLDHLRRGLQNYLIHDMSQSKYFAVLADDIIYQQLKDHDELNSQRFSSKILDAIRNEEGVDYFLQGNFGMAGEEYWITTKIRDAQKNELLGSEMAQGKRLADFPSMIDELTPKIKAQFMLSADQIASDFDENIEDITTGSTEAWQLFITGYKLIHERKHEESIKYFRDAIDLDPEFAMAYKVLGEAYRYTGKQEQSKECLLKALEYSHRVSERERYLIRAQAAYGLQGSIQQAIENYEELLKRYPFDEDGNKYLGSLYRIIEEWDLAFGCWEKLLKSSNKLDRYLAVDNIAHIFMVNARHDDALKILQSNQHLFPNQARYHRYLSTVYLCQHNYGAGLKEIETSLELEPENYINAKAMGQIRMLEEEFASADKTFKGLSEQDDQAAKIDSVYWLALSFLTQGRYVDCMDQTVQGVHMTEAPEYVYERINFYWLRTCVFLSKKQYAEASQEAARWMELAMGLDHAPAQKFALLYWGITQAMESKADDAKETAGRLKNLIEDDQIPKHMRYYHYLMGLIAKSEGRFGEAIAEYDSAISLMHNEFHYSNNNALFLEGLASAQYASKDLQSAANTYRKIAGLSVGRLTWGDKYSQSLFMLGKIEKELKHEKKAVEWLLRFLELRTEADPEHGLVEDAKAMLGELQANR